MTWIRRAPFMQQLRKYWAASCEHVSSGICGQQRLGSACNSAQSDRSLPCPLTESFYTTECMNGEQRSGKYFAHAHDDMSSHFAHVRMNVFVGCRPDKVIFAFLCI